MTQMKSRNRRALRALLTVNMVPLLVRLGFVVIFGGLIFVTGSVTLSDAAYLAPNGDFVMPLSDVIQVRLVIMALLAGVAPLSFVIGILDIFAEHRRRGDVTIQSVQHYLDANRFKKRRVILVLRPFDYDGFLFLDDPRGFWRTILLPAVRTSTVEQIFARQVQRFGDVDVVSIADPYKEELVPGPIYLTTGDDWQQDVRRLMHSADGIAFVIPPMAQLTPGLEWEINAAFGAGLAERGVAVFPPKRRKTPETAQVLQHFLNSTGAQIVGDIPLDRVFLVELKEEGQLWYEQPRRRLPWVRGVFSDVYAQAAGAWLDDRLDVPQRRMH
ncbi:MAG: hypothetical protein AAFQ19_02640 [Pseudomonadota bacterium]